MSRWEGTIWEAEQKLTDYYLRSDGPMGSAPLLFIDATDEELASALSIEDPAEARHRFLQGFHPETVRRVFQEDLELTATPSGLEVPGSFRYLILTCVIASIASEQSSEGDFRRRLSEQLETSTVFTDLSGVAALWIRLKAWCDRRRAEGKLYREVMLPDPGNWRQIGHSLKITFPSRRELDHMTRVFAREEIEITDPISIISVTQRRLFMENWSVAFRSAFFDFKKKFDAGQTLLARHPFVLAILRASQSNVLARTKKPIALELYTSLDDETNAVLRVFDAEIPKSIKLPFEADPSDGSFRLEFNVEFLPEMLSEFRNFVERGPLFTSLSEGLLLFEEQAWGCWSFVSTPRAPIVRMFVRRALVQSEQSEVSEWCLTKPVELKNAIDLLSKVRTRAVLAPEISRPEVIGGIKVNNSFLGLQCCMPSIKAASAAEVGIKPIDILSGQLSAQRMEGGIFSLSANSPLEGGWIAAVSEMGAPVADLKLPFVARANEYRAEFLKIDDTRWVAERELSDGNPEWVVSSERLAGKEATMPKVDYDFLEAIYASAAHGMAESNLIPLLDEYFANKGISPWDALHVLTETGWMSPRSSGTWRQRSWFLLAPRLVRLSNSTVMLDGATCRAIRDRFRQAIEFTGGYVFEECLVATWSVPTLVGIVPPGVTVPIDYPVERPAVSLPKNREKLSFFYANVSERTRTTKSEWSWTNERFERSGEDTHCGVRLQRLQHNGNRSADVYKVTVEGRPHKILESRAAGILVAHIENRKSLFNYDRERKVLVRVAHEGWLPVEVARYLRLRSLRGPGIQVDEASKKTRYLYPCGNDDQFVLADWLGRDVLGSQHAALNPLHGEVLKRRIGRRGMFLLNRAN